jgi:hypothetical protein
MRLQPLIERVTSRGRVLAVGLVAGSILMVFAANGASAVPPAQVPTPTPFRFLTPTVVAVVVVPGKTTTTTTTPPRAGGFPIELAIPALAGGLAAIGGGAYLFRRRTAR